MTEKHGIMSENDDLIITSGGQQAIEMTAKIFLNEGDTVICEEPAFVGALNALRSYGARLVGVPVDDDGMDVAVLEEKLKTEKNVKLIYTIPTFQNPTGTTMSLERRRKVLELAEKYDVMILEDSPYFELRFRGESVPTIKSMDKNGRVIFSGSYSKILSPGIRIGFACASKEIISKLTVAKQVFDVHTNLFFQMLAAEYLTNCDIDAHIAKICDMYRIKADKMLECMEKKFSPKVKFTRPPELFPVISTKNTISRRKKNDKDRQSEHPTDLLSPSSPVDRSHPGGKAKLGTLRQRDPQGQAESRRLLYSL